MRKFVRTRGQTGPLAEPTRPAPVPSPTPTHAYNNGYTHKLNGHANGDAIPTATRRDDRSSNSSRYWSESGRPELWQDEEFPASWRSLGERKYAAADVVWLRPHELSERPVFFGDASVEDEEESGPLRWWGEGELGGGALASWAVRGASAALAAAAPRLLARAVPPHQPLMGKRYTGRVRFEFCVWGTWRTVTVDDRLPARRGRLLGARTGALPHDYTLPLLEKAFAKLYGSYSSLRQRCCMSRALAELSGGVVQAVGGSGALAAVQAALPRSTLVVAAAGTCRAAWRCTKAGLYMHQPHLVSGLARVRSVSDTLLVRVRGCAGRGSWRGLWATHSPHWRALSSHDQDLLAARLAHHNEFWMSAEEFSTLTDVWLVHVGPDDWLVEASLRSRRPWRAVLARRRWTPGFNAGGSPPSSLSGYNPQFHVSVPAVGSLGGEVRAHAVVSVMQQYSPRTEGLLDVGFALFAASGSGPSGRALHVAHCGAAREVAAFFTLPPGEYRLMPHTRRPNQSRAFLLRIYTDTHSDVWEVNEDNVLVCDVFTELLNEPRSLSAESRALLVKLFGDADCTDRTADVTEVCKAANVCGARCSRGGGSLCATLTALCDTTLAGRARGIALVNLRAGCIRAKTALRAAADGRRSVKAVEARSLLRSCGAVLNNKVAEAVVLRHGYSGSLTMRAALHALAHLHLAHERYRILEVKAKSNPLSLEEVILMTLYT